MRLRDARFLVLDVVTTGPDPAQDKVIEMAWVTFHHGAIHGFNSTLVDPRENIPTAASHLYGITDDMVRDAPTLKCALIQVEQLLPHINALVAHNVPQDLGFLPELHKPAICTLAWTRRVWPERDHRLQCLGEEMGLRQQLPDMHQVAHRGLPDAMLTAMVLHQLIARSPEDLTLVDLIREQGLL